MQGSLPATVRRVRHELLDAGDHSRRRAAVPLPIRVAERPITFVDDHHHLSDGLDHAQHFLEVPFRRTHPFRAEVLELDRGQPALLGEGLRDERLSCPHRPGEQHAHRHTRDMAALDVRGDEGKVFLDGLHTANDLESMIGLHELDETEALALQDLALAPGDEEIDLGGWVTSSPRLRRTASN